MTEQTTTYVTPAIDVWAVQEERWLAEKREQTEAIEADRMASTKAVLLVEARALGIYGVKTTDTKESLAHKIALHLWHQSPMNVRFAEMRRAALVEEDIIDEVEKAEKRFQQKVDAAKKALTGDDWYYMAEHMARHAEYLAKAAVERRAWMQVKTLMLGQPLRRGGESLEPLSPTEALAQVTKRMLGEALSNGAVGVQRSSSQGQNLISESEQQARIGWVREAIRFDRSLRDLFAW